MPEKEHLPPNEENPDKKEPSESYDEIIVLHNLAMLNNQMMEVLFKESIGGNAGAIEIDGERAIEIDGELCSCAGVNGFVDKETGKIITFGNIQNVSRDIVKSNLEITLRVALAPLKYVIVDFLGKKELKNRALLNIEKAVEQYNLNWESRSKNKNK